MKSVVIKLGGSLLGSEGLLDWLDGIVRHGSGRIVVVPGGGSYADAVRASQAIYRFDEVTAHHQAIKAMQCSAQDLVALAPRMKLAHSIDEVIAILAIGGMPVAIPVDDWLAADDIDCCWDWTSDSLALWLARALCADSMLLVKSVTPDSVSEGAPGVAERALVDAAFPALLAECPQAVYWAGPQQSDLLPRWLDDEPVYCRLTGVSADVNT